MRSRDKDNFRMVVPRSLPQERLDSFLRRELPELSRGAIQRLIEEGQITIGGKKVKASHHPREGEEIVIVWPSLKAAEAQAEEIPLDILYEDEDLLVLNKGPGIVAHPAAGHEEHTLVNALLHHCQGRLSGIGGVERPGIVHRLDKDTSGCLVVAKSDQAHIALSEQFARREVEKIYQAIVCGELAQGHGEIRAAIARHPSHRKRMAVTGGKLKGREAWTTYHVLERLGGATFVEVCLHTGRTHQIRVHFHHIGHPLFGDASYGRRQNQRLKELAGYEVSRQMLHARKLVFTHPVTGVLKSFDAPLPGDFLEALSRLRGMKAELESRDDR